MDFRHRSLCGCGSHLRFRMGCIQVARIGTEDRTDSVQRNEASRRRKPAKAFIITEPSQAQRIPYRFEVGDQWIGLGEQSSDIVDMAYNGYLFLILYTAHGGRGHRARVKMRKKKATAA